MEGGQVQINIRIQNSLRAFKRREKSLGWWQCSEMTGLTLQSHPRIKWGFGYPGPVTSPRPLCLAFLWTSPSEQFTPPASKACPLSLSIWAPLAWWALLPLVKCEEGLHQGFHGPKIFSSLRTLDVISKRAYTLGLKSHQCGESICQMHTFKTHDSF